MQCGAPGSDMEKKEDINRKTSETHIKSGV